MWLIHWKKNKNQVLSYLPSYHFLDSGDIAVCKMGEIPRSFELNICLKSRHTGENTVAELSCIWSNTVVLELKVVSAR